jgi:hypothetical protein
MKNMLLEYLAFIALRDSAFRSTGGLFNTNANTIFWYFILLYAPSVLLALHLCMPSEKNNRQCAKITGTLCALSFTTAIFAPLTIGWTALNFGVFTSITSFAGAIAVIIGFNARNSLYGKAHRKSLSVLLILMHFIVRSAFLFWRMML